MYSKDARDCTLPTNDRKLLMPIPFAARILVARSLTSCRRAAVIVATTPHGRTETVIPIRSTCGPSWPLWMANEMPSIAHDSIIKVTWCRR